MTLIEYINQFYEAICNDRQFFLHKNLLILGENNSGKSKMLNSLIKKLINKKNIFFIDSTNRKIFNNDGEIIRSFNDFKLNQILKIRIDRKYFNKLDVFTEDTGTELILSEILHNFQKYKNLFDEVLKIDLQKESDEIKNLEKKDSISFDRTPIDMVSEGIQSLIRVLMEVDFAYNNGCKYIFIDEIDLNLDYINSYNFINVMRKKYKHLNFVLTCHSIHTILGINGFDILKINKEYDEIENNNCYFFDSNDLDSIEMIESKIFRADYFENEMDNNLSILLNKLYNKIDVSVDINKISEDKLTTRQKIILNYIKEKSGIIGSVVQ